MKVPSQYLITTSLHNMKKILILISIALLIYSCQESVSNRIAHIIKKWENKEIIFPHQMFFTIMGQDTVSKYSIHTNKYSIITYVDSTGCTSCKLQLKKWQDFHVKLDSLTNSSVPIHFFLCPKDKKEIITTLKYEQFNYPVCIDDKDSLNILNNFSQEISFQTFLLDKDNKVVAIGNPIHNPKVKELYIKIITGEEQNSNKNRASTTIETKTTLIEMGELDWQKPHDAVFQLKNTGDNLLVIDDISTTCGCTSANYAKKPVNKGENLDITVTIKPKNKGYFEETITVYCNAENSPIQLKIKGNAI